MGLRGKFTRFIQENEEEGTWNWASLPEQAGLLRSAKSDNSRWTDYYRDKTDSGNFT
uniref:Uncharacterized protein n=1 Tax=Oryza punctata TaxID=4537 RepID=A0A0E0MNH8_ORYPU